MYEFAFGIARAGVVGGGVKNSFRAFKTSIDQHPGRDLEGDCPFFFGRGGPGEGGWGVFANGNPDLIACNDHAKGGLQGHGITIRPTAAVIVGHATGGDPKDGGGAHGDGLGDGRGGFIVGIATLGGGDGGGACGAKSQNGGAFGVGFDGCHAGRRTGVGNGKTGGSSGGEGYFGACCACGGEGKVDGLCAFCSTFVGAEVYCATEDAVAPSQIVVDAWRGTVEVGVIAPIRRR